MLLTFMVAIAGTSATTEDGRKVQLNDNGTWTEMKAIEPPATPTECSAIVAREVDRVTGTALTALKAPIAVSTDDTTGFIWNLLKNDEGTIMWTTKVFGASRCVEDDYKMNILFTDGSRLEIENDSKYNCDRSFTLYFGGPWGDERTLMTFATKQIQIARVWTSNDYLERAPSATQAAQLRAAFA